eukprot:SAG31_NODE_467_length_15267_cov_13.792919_5_plen_364_part_00
MSSVVLNLTTPVDLQLARVVYCWTWHHCQSAAAAAVTTIAAPARIDCTAATTDTPVLLLLHFAQVGYFFLYRLYGVSAIAVSLVANAGISALAARVGKQKTVAVQKVRVKLKQQEALLNELAANLPIWRLYGWGNMFISKLNKVTAELQTAGRWNVTWQTLATVLPGSIGPISVLISVGIHVGRGGALRLVDLLSAGSYIQIITTSMEWYTNARNNWRDLAAECKNLDAVLSLPDGEPLERTADGSISECAFTAVGNSLRAAAAVSSAPLLMSLCGWVYAVGQALRAKLPSDGRVALQQGSAFTRRSSRSCCAQLQTREQMRWQSCSLDQWWKASVSRPAQRHGGFGQLKALIAWLVGSRRQH